MKCFEYGDYCVGWIPNSEQAKGGRYKFFKDQKEYKEAYYKATFPAHPSLDKMIAAAGIRGGRCRHELTRRGR